MAVNFPANPTDGQTVVVGGKTYTYSSTRSIWTVQTQASSGTPSGGLTTYDELAELPIEGDVGDLAYVLENNRLYLWNGDVWFLMLTAVTPNTRPFITQGPEIGYLLSTTGVPTVITLAAQDPEGAPIQWTYSITSGSLGSTATITQQDNVFTITPSTNSNYAGQFELTFTVSDGSNILNTKSFIRLKFTSEDAAIGLRTQNTLIPTGFQNTTNLRFGKATAAMAGTLAVTSARRLVDGTADVDNNMVSVFSTLNGSSIIPIQEILPPSGVTSFGENNLAVYGNMVLVPGIGAGGREVYVYYKVGASYELTQTIVIAPGQSTTSIADNPSQPLSISESGLVMACAAPGSATGTGHIQVNIYTRSTTSSTTWTLRQTVTSFSGVTDLDSWPTIIKVSNTGKHIIMGSQFCDDVGADRGKVLFLTNTLLSQELYTWGNTGVISGIQNTSVSLCISCTSKSDDIFYAAIRGSTLFAINMYKYDAPTASWVSYSYSTLLGRVFASSLPSTGTSLGQSQGHFVAIPGRDGTNEVVFIGTVADPSLANISIVVYARVKNFDISGSSPPGSDNLSIINSNSWHVNSFRIPNGASNTVVTLFPYLSVDTLSGHIYLSTRGTYGGVTNSGLVQQYVPITITDTSKATNFSKTWYNKVLNYSATSNPEVVTETIIVQPGQNFLHGVCVGGGGAGGGETGATTFGAGGGGGGLRGVVGYPVFPGDIVTVSVGHGGLIQTGASPGLAGGNSSISVNGVVIVSGNGGGGGASSGIGGAGGTGFPTATGTGTTQTGPAGITYSTFGGNGGAGASTGAAGGGAGGYSANGGAAGAQGTNGAAGLGGGGGGGGGASNGGSDFHGGFGGGVGLYGVGGNGVGGVSGGGGTAHGNPGGAGSLDLALDIDRDSQGTISFTATFPTFSFSRPAVECTGGGGIGSPYGGNDKKYRGHGGGVRLMLTEYDRAMTTPTVGGTILFRPPGYTLAP